MVMKDSEVIPQPVGRVDIVKMAMTESCNSIFSMK